MEGLSVFEGGAVTLGLMLANYLVTFYVLRYAVDTALAIISPGPGRSPMPARMRWVSVYHGVVPALTFLIILHFFLAVGFWTMAGATAGSLAWLVRAAALVAASGGVFGVLFYSVYVYHLMAVVREESK